MPLEAGMLDRHLIGRNHDDKQKCLKMTSTAQKQSNMENVPPRKNNLVSNSELQNAVKAMKEHLEEWKTAGSSKTSSLDDDSRQVLVHLIEQAETSVTSHLVSLVEPVSDEEYHSHVRPSLDDEVSDKEDDELSDVDDHSEEELDEEALLDQEALQRARDLRRQVREAAERVGTLRTSVTDRAVAVGQREVALLVGPKTQDAPFDADAVAAKFNEPFQGEKKENLEEMEVSLQRLSKALKNMDVELPEKIENLQKTVEVIQEALKQGTSLSQTEKAIRSRQNEGPSVQETVDQDAPPEKRLATFLGQY